MSVPLTQALDLKAMNTPYNNPTSQLEAPRVLFRLSFSGVFTVAITFVACMIGSSFFPIDSVLDFLFRGSSKSNVQPAFDTAALLGTLILIIWLIVYYVVTRVSNRFVVGILASSTVIWLSLFSLVVAMDAESPGGASDINIAAINSVIGFFIGTLAALAVARYLRRPKAI